MASSLRRAVTATMLCLFVLAISCGRFGLYKDVYGDSDVSMDADVEVNDDADMDAERENDADVESEAGVDADVPLSAPVHIASISFQLVALEEPEFSVADIAVSDAGDVLLVGAFSGTASFGGPSHVSNGNEDCFVASFTDDLIYQWSESYGGSSSDHMTSVDVNSSGSVWMSGLFEGSIDVAGSRLVSNGDDDRFVARYNDDGVGQFAASYGSAADDDYGGGIATTVDGFALTGSFSGPVDLGGGTLSGSGRDPFVALFTSDGAHLASDRWSGSGLDYSRSISVRSDGTMFVAGTFESDLDIDGVELTALGSSAGFVACLEPDLSPTWVTKIESDGEVGVASIALTESGNVAVSGWGSGMLALGDLVATANDFDGWAALLSPDGEPLWLVVLGGAESDEADMISAGPSDSVYVVGCFEGTAGFGDFTVDGRGDDDIFLCAITAGGEVAWVHTFGGPGDDEGEAVDIGPNGDVYISGFTTGPVDFGDGEIGGDGLGMFLVRMR